MNKIIQGTISTIAFVLLIVVVYFLIDGLQEGPMGHNKYSNETLKHTKSAVNILTNGYFLASLISGLVILIGIILWIRTRE